MQQIPFKHEKKNYCKGDQTLAQISQTGCGISTLGDIQKPTERCPEQSTLADPALNKGKLDLMIMRGPFQCQLFCDCVKFKKLKQQ